MHAYALLALAGAAAALPQTSQGCNFVNSYSGDFTIEAVRSSHSKRQTEEAPQAELDLTLNNGVMMDKFQRTGYVASNYQFQFDTGAQPGALETGGWTVCQATGELAITDSTDFWACKVDTYYNLYTKNVNANCQPVNLYAVNIGSSGSTGGEQSDGQPTLTAIGEKTDGQPTVGAIQTTPPSVGEKTDGQPTVGAIQTTPPAVGEKTDGQPTVGAIQTSPPAVGEKTDGQPTVGAIQTSAPAVGEKTDGQPTVGAIQTSIPAVGEKTDGQPTVTALLNSTVAPLTANAAATPKVEMLAFGAAALAAALL